DVAGHVQTGLPTDKIDSTDSGIVVPKGYHVAAKNTLNGKDIKVTTTINKDGQTIANIPASEIGKDGSNIVYTIQKNVPVTVKVVTVDAKGNAVPANEQVPAKTTNGVVVNDKDATPVQSGSATDAINSTDSGIVVPKGYHVAAKNTVNGKDIKVTTTTKDGQTIANIPASEIGKDGSNIVYTITKDATITKGVTVKVVTVDANGNPVPTKEQVPTTTVSGIKVTDAAGHVQTGLPTDKIDSTDSGIVVPKGYHVAAKNTLNGKDIKVTTTTNKDGQTIANIPASEIGKDGSNIVYTITKDAPKTGKVVVNVNIVDGKDTSKVLSTPVKGLEVQSGDVGTAISNKADLGNIPGVPKGYHLVGTTTLTKPEGSNATLGKDGETVTGAIADGTTEITYHIAKDAPVVNPPVKPETPKVGNVVVTINEVGSNGQVVKVLVNQKTTVKEVKEGTAITRSNYTDVNSVVPKGYHLVSSSIVNATGGNGSVSKDGTVSGSVGNGTTQIVYNIEKDAPVVNPPVKPETPKVGNVVVTINEVGSNGQVVKVLVNQETTVKEVKEGTAITNSNYTDVNSVVPKGYHLVSSSIANATGGNGSVSKDGTVSGSVGNGTTQIVYNIEKDAPVVNPPVKPVNPTPVQKTGKVTVKVVDNNGNVVVKQHTVTEGNVGGTVTGTGYTPEKGSHIVGITINGKEVKVVPDMKIPDGTTHIVYTIAKDPTPVNPTPVQKTGKVTVKVVDNNGNVVVKQHTVTEGNVGGAVTGTGYTPEKGSHIVGITINGKEVKVVPDMKIPDGTTHIVYTIAKDPTPVNPTPVQKTGKVTVKVVDNNGNVVVRQHTVTEGNVGGAVTGTGYTPEKGSHIVGITINGKEVKVVPNMKIPDGTTHIVYTIAKDPTPAKPNTGDGSNTDSTPIAQPNTGDGNNTDSTPIVQPNTGDGNNTDSTPIVQPNTGDGDNTDSTPIVQPNTNNGDSTNSTPIVNNNNKIPVVSVNNKGVAKVDTLPDTGISNAIPSNAAKDAAGIAGLLGIIGLGFLFKRKK
ncbi:MAG: hypothetical protein ACRCWG_12935, partial [Sarcina sp.]